MKLAPTLLFPLLLASAAPGTTPARPPATRPAEIALSLTTNKDAYTLNPAQSGKAFRDRLDQLRERGEAAPSPPAVDLTLKFTNHTAAPITLPFGGDDSTLHLKLDGPGAVNIPNNVAMTMEFRTGRPVTIPPGQSHELKITSLASGARGIAHHSYFTEPGDYTLTARFECTSGERQASLLAPPLKLVVTAPG